MNTESSPSSNVAFHELPHKTPSLGLNSVIRSRVEIALQILLPQWLVEPQANWKRVVRPTGDGAFSINVEPYQGFHSWINFRKKFLGIDLLQNLELVIRELQPALLGYVNHPDGGMAIQDVFALTMTLCQSAQRYVESGLNTEQAIRQVIEDLDQVLTTGSARKEVLTALSGLRLPEGIERIELDENLCIRRLTAAEISDMGSNDISDETRYDITSKFVTTAIVSSSSIPITLSELHLNFTPDFSLAQAAQDQLLAILCALHTVKTGRVGIVASFTSIHPKVLPNLGGLSSSPLVVNPFAFMDLTQVEVDEFVSVYSQFVRVKRDELHIAATRLLDAESRLSPVDSLMDSVIGLEVLLNPNDYSELSFRVALNYAYLGALSERRGRYEKVRDIQKTRNKVVHGGLNLRSRDAAKIHEHAELAKNCLRDTIKLFLADDYLSGNSKLDADYWLDKVIPPNEMK